MSTTIPAPGTPATILMHTDTTAAVVTRVNGKSVWVRTVETTNERNESENLAPTQLPVRIADGLTDRPVGGEIRYTLRKSGRYVQSGQPDTRGVVRVVFGRSITRRDYSF